MSEIKVRKLSSVTDADLTRLLDRHPESDPTVMDACWQIVERVGTGGDEALLACTREFDGVILSAEQLRVSNTELARQRGL